MNFTVKHYTPTPLPRRLVVSLCVATLSCGDNTVQTDNQQLGAQATPCLSDANDKPLDAETYMTAGDIDRNDMDHEKAAAILLRLRASYPGKEQKELDDAIRVLLPACTRGKANLALEQIFDMRFVEKAELIRGGCTMFLSNDCFVCGKQVIGKTCVPMCPPGGSPFDPPLQDWRVEYTRTSKFDSKDPRPRWNPQWNP
jgi:hypothetical protein